MQKPQIKLPDSIIENAENPWEDDKLGREECANILTTIVDDQQTALTISINGEWGSGKTFMLKRWCQDLENNGYIAIYFNAWEDDFIEDPLVAIFGQLWRTFENNKSCKDATNKLEEISSKIHHLLVTNWKLIGMNVTNDLIKHSTGVDFKSAAMGTETSSIFQEYMKMARIRNEVQSLLYEFINAVYNRNVGNANNQESAPAKKPLVFIVDELDRCRPTFAIEVLERIKHLFNIDHLIFVFGIDRIQLGNVIKSVYGNIDVENYLHRFIDLDFQLPPASHKQFIDMLWKQYEIPEHLSEKSKCGKCENFNIEEGKQFKDFFCKILNWHNFNLREIEHALKLYALLLRLSQPNHFTWPILVTILIVLKFKNNELYRNYILQKTNVEDVVNYLIPDSDSDDSWTCDAVQAIIYSTYLNEHYETENDIAIKKIIDAIKQQSSVTGLPHTSKRLQTSTPESLANFINYFNNFRNYFGQQAVYDRSTLKMVAEKIDLLGKN